MKKRILFVVLLLVGLFLVVSCKPRKETFRLTLPEGITSNQRNNSKIAKDANVIITITVPEGKEIDSLKVNGVEKKEEVVSNKLSFKMTKNTTVTVNFEDILVVTYYALTLPDGVVSNQESDTQILKDTNVELTITVPEGKKLGSLKVDGVEKKADVINNKLTVKMTKDITVIVVFEDLPPTYYSLTLPDGVTSDQSDNTSILKDTDVTLTIVVPEGKKLKSLKIDGNEKKDEVVANEIIVKMTKDITVTVSFEEITIEDVFYALTLPVGVLSDQTDNTKILENTNVVLTIVVPEGKKLCSIKVDDIEKKDEVVANKLTIKMTKDITVTVVFEDLPLAYYSLTLPDGVTSDQSDNTKILKDTNVILTIVVPDGKKLESLKVDGIEKKAEVANNKLTIKMTKDIIVTVVFEDLPPTYYSLTLPDGVTSDQSDNTKILENTNVELTIVVPEGKKLESIKVDGIEKKAEVANNKLRIKMTKNIIVTISFGNLAPELNATLYHWMPGAKADDTGLKADVNLFGATFDEFTGAGLVAKIGEKILDYIVDYEITNNELIVFGQTLHDANLELGDYELTLTSNYGTSSMEFHVVDNPVGTSIPTKTIKGVDMNGVAAYIPTAPIAGAPDLLITELGLDRGVYDYIEVFNNTVEPYNLKNHYIIYGNTDNQPLLQEYGLMHISNSARSSTFIYKDFIIPALSSAYIWVPSGVPWKAKAITGNPTLTHEVYVSNEKLLYGLGEDQINEAKFKNRYNLPEETLVFFVRLNYTLFNNPHVYNSTTGFGSPVNKNYKEENNYCWISNSMVDNRMIQILKIDVDKVHSIPDGDTTVPAGATYFKWEFGVENKEEDVFVDGVLDKTKIKVHGKRESIDALYIRRVFYNESHELVGYSTKGTNELDLYNISDSGLNAPKYLEMWKSVANAVVAAHFYPKLSKVGDVIENNKWGTVSLEYTVPSAEMPGLMRFVQRDEVSLYAEFYQGQNAMLVGLKLAGLAPAVSATMMDKDIIVPENPAYPTRYVNSGYTTIGRTTWFNFLETEPEE